SVFEIDCACLYHGSFPIAEIIKEPFFYPPVYLINYDKMVFARSNRCKIQVNNVIERWISRPRFLFRPPSDLNPSFEGESFPNRNLTDLWLVHAQANLPDLSTPTSVQPNTLVEPSAELDLSQAELPESESEEEID
ncbi:MAG TPA: hypothetical protein VJ044_12025, partial [Candidatus Hodarchaeales archaeon]|nr:hypothetical protein [Candidatus Hodarchaeales archaeon]